MKLPEVGLIISSTRRMEAIERYSTPKNVQDVIEILSDQTDDDFRVYQDISPTDRVKTIATGENFLYDDIDNIKFEFFDPKLE